MISSFISNFLASVSDKELSDALELVKNDPGAAKILLILLVLGIILGIVFYIVIAYGVSKLAKKLNYSYPWFSYIPILNLWLLVQISGLQWWWFLIAIIGSMVGGIGGVIFEACVFYIWLQICLKVGKPPWFALLMLIPIVNIWAVFELAKQNNK